LSVIGYDDLEIAEHLGLTTIRQPLYESGTRGARMLLDLMDADTRIAQHVELPIELIARGSTARPGRRS
jgi:DNA-binding LacI/PurR family transcriptional regulator